MGGGGARGVMLAHGLVDCYCKYFMQNRDGKNKLNNIYQYNKRNNWVGWDTRKRID